MFELDLALEVDADDIAHRRTTPPIISATATQGRIAIERALCPVLIGRGQELGLIEDALLASLRGEGQVVVLAGDAGIGKTRLAAEVSRRAAKVGCVVVAGSCSEAELALPYLPFMEGLGNFLALTDLEQLRTRLGQSRRELAQLFPQLGSGPAPVDGGDPSQAKLRLFEAVLGLLRIAAENNGLLLVLEDLQWADASSRELLDYLTRRMRNSKIMVLASYRREDLTRQHPLLPTIQGWRRSGLARVVELQAMSAESVAGMMRAIFDAERVTDEFRDFMHGRSEGNPFVLEEMLKTALDRRVIFLSPETGAWERKAIPELGLPSTVRDSILFRVEQLKAVEAEILRAAAVLGRFFDYSILTIVSERRQSTVEAALHAAIGQQLVEEDPGLPGRYRFRHALTQEAIYQDLSAHRRQQLHFAAAEALKRRSEPNVADLAHHLMAANRWHDATPVCLQAAEAAKRGRGYREAATLYARMLPHLSDPRQQGRVRCLLGDAQYRAGDYGEARHSLEAGIRALELLDRGREAAHYRLILGQCHWEQSRPALARAEFEHARTILEAEEPSEDLAFAYVNLARLRFFDSDYPEVLALVDRGIETARAAGADAPRIWGYNYRGTTLARLGQTADGLADLDRSYREAVERDLDWIASGALANATVIRLEGFRLQEALGSVQLQRAMGGLESAWGSVQESFIRSMLGEPERAREVGEEALALVRQAEWSALEVGLESGLALAYSALGRFQEARQFLDHAQSSELPREHAHVLTQTAMRVRLDDGDLLNAVPHAQSVLADFHQHPEFLPDIGLIDVAVEAFVNSGMPTEAMELLERARTAPIQPDNPYLARIEGQVALGRGDLHRARDHLETAAAYFAKASYRDDEWRTRRRLAEVKIQLGDRIGAEAELRAVLTGAEEHRHVTHATAARHQLSALGIEVAAAAAVPAMGVDDLRQVGERFVTVMFVDVRGYTAFSAVAAPADLADRVATFYRWTEQEIARHHGLVAQYGGDAVLATFNVSGLQLDHCLHALQSALGIRDKAAYNGLPVGVGIAVGPAVVGQFSQGSPVTAVGETINLAARLQTSAGVGEIVLAAEAFRRVRDWLQSAEVATREESLMLKGFAQPVVAYRLPARTRSMTEA